MSRIPLAAALATAALGAAAFRSQDSAATAPAEGATASGAADDDGLVAPSDGVLALGCLASHPRLLAGGAQDVWLYVPLRAAEVEGVPRPGMNLALVIDRSGSMGSEDKLVFAKAAAEQLVGRLRADDRLSIVAYDDEVSTVVPSTRAGERDVFVQAIRALAPGRATDLCGGMVRGYEEVLEHVDGERLNRVLLLSDGLANRGVTGVAAIGARAAACRETGVRISTMGMGLDYDERILRGVAHRAGGNYYYVAEPEAVGLHLDRELDELAQVVARDVELSVELGDGVEVADVYGYVHRVEGRTLRVSVPDVTSGERRKVVVRLRASGTAGASRRLASASLRYVDRVAGAPRTAGGGAVDVAFTDLVEEVSASRRLDVLVKVEIVQNAVAMDDAMALQREGRIDGAQELLAARYVTSRALNEAEYRSAELTRMLETMKRTLQELERTRADAEARRDLQLATGLEALGYLGGD